MRSVTANEGTTMGVDSFGTIIQPGLRFWREYQEYERAHVAVIPALDKGPQSGRIHINLDTREVVIDPESQPDQPDR